MFAIVGLGNPEKKYENTYHNIGFIAIDNFAKEYGLVFSQTKYDGRFASGLVEGEKVILLKPSTYMNLSGQSVSKMVNHLKLPLKNLIVIYDDIEFEPGIIRVRTSGSAGTHNGIKDIVEKLGSTDFSRIRVGIGRPQYGDLSNYVLDNISPENKIKIEDSLGRVNNCLINFIKKQGDIESETIK